MWRAWVTTKTTEHSWRKLQAVCQTYYIRCHHVLITQGEWPRFAWNNKCSRTRTPSIDKNQFKRLKNSDQFNTAHKRLGKKSIKCSFVKSHITRNKTILYYTKRMNENEPFSTHTTYDSLKENYILIKCIATYQYRNDVCAESFCYSMRW